MLSGALLTWIGITSWVSARIRPSASRSRAVAADHHRSTEPQAGASSWFPIYSRAVFDRTASASRNAEDPSVAAVEHILEATASLSAGAPPRRDGRLVVSHAIWLCACETTEDSPIWLIYAVGDEGIGWQRIPDGMHVPDVVEAEHLTGDHPSPASVLAWLHSDSPDRWPGRRGLPDEDVSIFEEIRRRIASR